MMEHGTNTPIAAGCDCRLCVLVRETRPRRRPASVPAGESRDRLLALLDAGWTLSGLADHIGYPVMVLDGIVAGRSLFTSRYIAEDVLSVPVRADA